MARPQGHVNGGGDRPQDGCLVHGGRRGQAMVMSPREGKGLPYGESGCAEEQARPALPGGDHGQTDDRTGQGQLHRTSRTEPVGNAGAHTAKPWGFSYLLGLPSATSF
jgi:hypothetical protein